MLNILLLSISMIFMFTGCSSQNKSASKPGNTKTDRLNVSKGENAENKILFLTLGITLTDSARDTYEFTLINAIFGEGILNKSSFKNDEHFEPYHLYCEITDGNKRRVDFIKVKNPLLKVFEYSPDKESLEKRLFTSKTGEIYLRFQFSKHSKYLSIYKPLPDLRTLKKIYHAQI